MQQAKFESDRISVASSKELLEITISGKIPSGQLTMLTAWLLAWTIAGFYVISQVFSFSGDQLIYLLVWLGFWAYFEYRIGTAWLWRKFGKEVFRIEGDETQLRFEVSYGGRATAFKTEDLRNFKNLENDKGKFVKSFFSSYWVVGGETIGFYHKGKLHTFGRQITSGDADKLISLIQKRIL